MTLDELIVTIICGEDPIVRTRTHFPRKWLWVTSLILVRTSWRIPSNRSKTLMNLRNSESKTIATIPDTHFLRLDTEAEGRHHLRHQLKLDISIEFRMERHCLHPKEDSTILVHQMAWWVYMIRSINILLRSYVNWGWKRQRLQPKEDSTVLVHCH